MNRTRPGRRTLAGLVIASAALVGAACAPMTPPGTTTTTTTTTTSTTTTTTLLTVDIPGFTYQFPSFSLQLPPVGINFGCSATYNPPSLNVAGPTLVIRRPRSTPVPARRPCPAVSLNGFNSALSLGQFTISCPVPFLPPLTFSTGVVAHLSAGAGAPGAFVNLDDNTIVVPGFGLTISANLTFQGFGGLVIPLPNQTVQLPTAVIPIPNQ